MKLIAYGEDALTLWAIKRRLPEILQKLNDHADPKHCQVIFRPSFGRRGGTGSAQFGEFDFILLSANSIYLGESKWDRSPEGEQGGKIELREEQNLRHRIFAFYVERYAFGTYTSRTQFLREALSEFSRLFPGKALAPEGSLLAENLQSLLKLIALHFGSHPEVRNVLLYLHARRSPEGLPSEAPPGFDLVLIDYSSDTIDNFIGIDL